MNDNANRLFIITAIVKNALNKTVTSYALAVATCDDDEDNVVDIDTAIKVAQGSDDPAAALKSWGIWSTRDPKQAQRAVARARRSARRWDVQGSPIGFYDIGSAAAA